MPHLHWDQYRPTFCQFRPPGKISFLSFFFFAIVKKFVEKKIGGREQGGGVTTPPPWIRACRDVEFHRSKWRLVGVDRAARSGRTY